MHKRGYSNYLFIAGKEAQIVASWKASAKFCSQGVMTATMANVHNSMQGFPTEWEGKDKPAGLVSSFPKGSDTTEIHYCKG